MQSKHGYYKIILLSMVLYCLTPVDISYAETMSGTTYTLNGSISTINGQGQGGTYTLNSSGNAITIGNASGGTYSLYPTPYGTNPAVSSSGGQTSLGAVISGIMFGDASTASRTIPSVLIPVGSTTTVTPIGGRNTANPNNSNGGVYDDGFFGEYTGYRDYTYTDIVNFGRGTSTFSEKPQPSSYHTVWLLIKIILIGILLIFLKVWHQYRKNL